MSFMVMQESYERPLAGPGRMLFELFDYLNFFCLCCNEFHCIWII